MSEVNADGTLLDPEAELERLVRHKTTALFAPRMHDRAQTQMTRRVRAANGAPAGTVGGAPHVSAAAAEPRPRSMP